MVFVPDLGPRPRSRTTTRASKKGSETVVLSKALQGLLQKVLGKVPGTCHAVGF